MLVYIYCTFVVYHAIILFFKVILMSCVLIIKINALKKYEYKYFMSYNYSLVGFL